MTDRTSSIASDGPLAQRSEVGQDCLTEPQREMARLIGRLLAERWQQEEQAEQAAGPRQRRNGGQ